VHVTFRMAGYCPKHVVAVFIIVHFPCSYITYTVFITDLLHCVSIVINYRSEMFRPQLSAIFRELASFSMCAGYVSPYVGEILHIGAPL
jgi:hypothetical protein